MEVEVRGFCQRLEETRVRYQTHEHPINTCLCEEILLKLTRREWFLLIKRTSSRYEMDYGIHFTVKTRNCPFPQLLQLALCCRLQHCLDKVRHHCNEFWNFLFILTSEVTIWCIRGQLSNFCKLHPTLHPWVFLFWHFTEVSRVYIQAVSISAGIVIEVIDYLALLLLHLPSRLCFQSSLSACLLVVCFVFFLYFEN